MTLTQVQDSIHDLSERIHFGCGNSGCFIVPPLGPAMKGICHCAPHDIAQELLILATHLEDMQQWEKD